MRHARSLVLDVSGGDGDTTGLLFRSLVDHVVAEDLALAGLLSEDLGDSGSEGGLAVAVGGRRSAFRFLGGRGKVRGEGSALLDVSDRAAGHGTFGQRHVRISTRVSTLLRTYPMFMCGSLRSNLPPASAA
jgi:hypothetical protein